jgi:hypothetical protein
MKKVLFILWAILLLLVQKELYGQENTNSKNRYWQVGIGFGEIPYKGSFKPSITFGYYFNSKLYAGVIYQFKDEIKRDGSSFNAQSTGLNGLQSSREQVAARFLVQGRYTPVKNGPYLSFGFVYNGDDTETMRFDNRERTIQNQTYTGSIVINQTRKAGFVPALGIGYQYTFKSGFSLNAEWTPGLFTEIVTPEYSFSGDSNLSSSAKQGIMDKMTDAFKSNITNRYKVFHIGAAYVF